MTDSIKCLLGSRWEKGCRCEGCTNYSRQSDKRYLRRKKAREASGAIFSTDVIDATRTRETLLRILDEDGLTQLEVSRVLGYNTRTIRCVYSGRQTKCTRGLADAVESTYGKVTPRTLAPGTLVSTKRSHQIVKSLHAQGWTLAEQRRILNKAGLGCGGFLDNLANRETMRWENAQRILWMSQHLGDKTGPSHLLAVRTVHEGFYPQIHYDDSGNLIRKSIPKKPRKKVR